MGNSREDLVRAVSTARDQARELLAQLEQQGLPETAGSSSLYLALVSLLKRLNKEAPAPAAIAVELDQLATMCEGKLAPLKPLLEDASRVARGT